MKKELLEKLAGTVPALTDSQLEQVAGGKEEIVFGDDEVDVVRGSRSNSQSAGKEDDCVD